MNVKIDYLIAGCILADDVFKLSNTPLIRKKTVITDEHINILKLFMVEDVFVEPKLVDGKAFKPKEVIKSKKDSKTEDMDTIKKDSFMGRFLNAVQQYKKLFMDWQGGSKIDANSVRKVFLPLYELEPTKDELIQLYQYGTKKDYIHFHSVAVSVFSFMLGKRLGLKDGDIIQLGLAGLLSDCGMAKLSFNVFEKKDSLSQAQYEEVKKHPIFSYRMLEKIPGFSKSALLGILQHHEREDGTGYPLKIKRAKLHQYARVIAIGDVFHAMTSETHYRSKKSPYKVIELLTVDEFGKLDHAILSEFIKMMVDLSIGRRVRLNNGLVGEVLFENIQNPTRPIIKIHGEDILDLSKQNDIHILEELLEENY